MGWVGSPYEDDKSVTVKQDESKQLDQSVSTKSGPIGTSVNWFLDATASVSTLYDNIKGMFSNTDVVDGKPKAGYPEGRTEQNTQIDINRGPETQGGSGGFYEQVKGLFNLTFPQTEPQTVSTKASELPSTAGIAGIGTGTIVIGAIILYLLAK